MFRKRGFLAVGLVLMFVCGVAFGAEQAKTGCETPQEKLNFAVCTDVPKDIRSNIPIYNNTLPSHIAVFRLKNLPRLNTSREKPSSENRSNSISSSNARARAIALARARARRARHNVSDNHWNAGIAFETKVSVYGEDFVNSLLHSKPAKQLSDIAKDMIKTGDSYLFKDCEKNETEIKVYAFSQPDAEKMVKAIVEVFEDYASDAREKTSNVIAELKENIEKSQKAYDEDKEMHEKIHIEIDETRTQGHYTTLEKVRERISTLNVFIEDKKIKLDGLQAKINAIEKLTASNIKKLRMNKQATAFNQMLKQSIKFSDMLTMSSINVDQARGEYDSAVKIRNQAEEYLALHDKQKIIEADMRKSSGTMHKYKKEFEEYEQFISRDQSEWFMPVFDSDPVMIYSLKPVKEQ